MPKRPPQSLDELIDTAHEWAAEAISSFLGDAVERIKERVGNVQFPQAIPQPRRVGGQKAKKRGTGGRNAPGRAKAGGSGPTGSKGQSASQGAGNRPKITLYSILGVLPDAEYDVIKAAHRALSRKYHPDNKETGDATRMRVINAAWEVLGDEKNRAEYDRGIGL